MNADIYNAEYFPAEYIVYRRDRSELNSSKSKGGGILIAVHSTIVSDTVDCDPTIELLCVKLNICKKSINVIGLYIPPNSETEVYTKYTQCLFKISSSTNIDDNVLILGDFNLPNVKWVYDVDVNYIIPCNVTSTVETSCIDSILSYGFIQINDVPNYIGRFLDLFFTNSINLYTVIEAPVPYIVNDINHKSMEVNLNQSELLLSNSIKNNFISKFYDFKRADFDSLISFFSSIDWNARFSFNDLDHDVQLFYNILFSGIDRFVPISVFKNNRNNPPWFNKCLINLGNRKKKLYRKWKRSNNASVKLAFSSVSNEFDSMHKIAYRNYINKVQNDLILNPKSFWNFVQSRRKTCGFPSTMSYNNVSGNNSIDVANLFGSFFQNTYRLDNVNKGTLADTTYNSTNTTLHIPRITPEDIIKSLTQFKDGCGPDGVPSSFLKKLGHELAFPLSILFNGSLSSGIFPVVWKSSHIVPIFKSGNRNDVSNYRGISILSAIPKLFESIVCDHMYFGLKSFIVDEQHGFFRGRSTVSNLMEFSKRALEVIEAKAQLDVIYTDFSKAFDSINHVIVLEKLKSFGISNNLLKWIESYLTERIQFVKINDRFSNPIKVHSGVPQGSHLGPLIFILFLNDITKCVKFARCLIYADDLKIFSPINNTQDSFNLQKDIDAISHWCENNLLFLNTKKCKIMSFTRSSSYVIHDYCINNDKLSRITEVRDLGVMFTQTLSVNRHIDLIIAKACSMLGFLKRIMKEFNNPKALISLYQSLVRSQLEYASCVWCPSYSNHVKRIEAVQKSFLIFYAWKTIGFDNRRMWWENVLGLPPYTERCKSLKLEPLDIRRQHAGAIFISNLLNGEIVSPYLLFNLNLYAPVRNLRTRTLLKLDFHKTNYGCDEPLNLMSKFYNQLSMFCDFNMTKSGIRLSLKENYFK